MPIVETRLAFAEEKDDSNVPSPAAIIRGPNRFAGLQYQATSPPST